MKTKIVSCAPLNKLIYFLYHVCICIEGIINDMFVGKFESRRYTIAHPEYKCVEEGLLRVKESDSIAIKYCIKLPFRLRISVIGQNTYSVFLERKNSNG